MALAEPITTATVPFVPDELVDSKEVARMLGISERSVRDLASRGELPALAIRSPSGKRVRYRFDPDAIKELARARAQGGNQ